MATTALQVAAAAYSDAGTDQAITSFSMTEWPYSIALDVINSAIADLNRMGSFRFAEASLVLPYSFGVVSYNLDSVGTTVIEPGRIIRIRRELANQAGKLIEYAYSTFQNKYRNSAVPTQKPIAWSKYANLIYLNSIPDQDYTLTTYYYKQIQPIVVGTNDNSATIIPEYHIVILRDMTNALLLKEMGRPDFANQYTLAVKKAAALVARNNEDSGLLTQMPRSF